MERHSVLFVCIHNSARSQMAEAFLNELGAGKFEAESAGLEPGRLNQNVVAVMQEAGTDMSGNAAKSVFDMLEQGRQYDYVITVCDAASAEACPVFPGMAKKLGWWFADPSQFTGTTSEILAQTRIVRDEIKLKVMEFIDQHK